MYRELKPYQIEAIKRQYPPGTRIQVDHMGDDPCPIEPGICGTVRVVDDIGTLHCDFDNGRSLRVLWGVDSFHVIEQAVSYLAKEKISKMSDDDLADYEITRFRSVEELFKYAFEGESGAGLSEQEKMELVSGKYSDDILFKFGDCYYLKNDSGCEIEDTEQEEATAEDEGIDMM